MKGNHGFLPAYIIVREPRRLNLRDQFTRYDSAVHGCAAVKVNYFAVILPLPRIPKQGIQDVSDGQNAVNSDTDLLVLSFNSVITLIHYGRKKK